MQEINGDGVRKHVANLVVSQQVCELCYKDASRSSDGYTCNFCSLNKLQWFWNDQNESCIEKFINYLDSFVRPVTAVCHNFKSYDGHLILEQLSKKSAQLSLVLNGWKIMIVKYKNVRFIDSLNFMQMPLSKFATSFSLPSGIAKTFFPHIFNTTQNQAYVGMIPDKEMYGYENFNSKQLREFNEWYQTQENTIFNFSEQLLEYCISDVNVLRMGSLKFMQSFIDMLHVNPLIEAVTLTSSLMLGYRKRFLQPNTLGIVPSNEYSGNKHQSLIGRKWLELMNRRFHRRLVYEYKLPDIGLYVDGYLSARNPNVKGLVFNFLGCYWHSCVVCYKDNAHMKNKDEMNARRETTRRQLVRMRNAGYSVKCEWECVFRRRLKENPDLDASLSNSSFVIHAPIACREATYGGLVDCFRTYYKTKPGERIVGLDFKSLYPYCNKYSAYPVRHPRIHRGIECNRLDLKSIHGIIKCRILPPLKLFHPVLPVKVDGRLLMGLCHACMIIQSQTCSHTSMERSLLGTWVIAEVNLAIMTGYTIMKIIEIWEYDVEQYNPQTKMGGIFTDYVNMFMTIKESSSGWPRENMTLEEKQEHINNFEIHEGITLIPSEIVKHTERRQLAKVKNSPF